MKILIKNVNVITPYEILEKYAVSIENGKIKNIGKDDDFNKDDFDEVINAEDRYLSPGFIDVHNHGNFGYSTMDGTFEALDSMSNFHLKNGVTGFLATTVTSSPEKTKEVIKTVADYIEVQNIEDEQEKIDSQVLGLYLEGPYFSQIKKGAQPAEYIKNPDLEELKEFIRLSNGNVKIVALAPETPGALEAISYLRSEGITIAAGHTNATFEEAKVGIDRGITQVTHLYNGMRGFSHREPAVLGAALTDERIDCEMICDGIHLHTAAMQLAVKMKGNSGIILISDAMMATGIEEGEYELGNQKVFVKNGEARLADGTLAGSTLTLNKAVYNIVHMVNVPLKDAVRMASLNPARSIGLSNKKGSIEIGKDADLIIFDECINVSTVIVNGKVLSFD